MLLSESFQKNSRWSSHFGSHEPRLTTECDDIPVPEILLLFGWYRKKLVRKKFWVPSHYVLLSIRKICICPTSAMHSSWAIRVPSDQKRKFSERNFHFFYEILVDLVEVNFPPTSLSPSSILFSSISLLISFSSAYSYSSTSPPGSAWVNSDRWGDEKKCHLEGDGDDTGSY